MRTCVFQGYGWELLRSAEQVGNNQAAISPSPRQSNWSRQTFQYHLDTRKQSFMNTLGAASIARCSIKQEIHSHVPTLQTAMHPMTCTPGDGNERMY